MTDSKQALQQQLDALRQENDRQKKIIDSLIHRVEKGSRPHGDAWSAFQHSVVLADQVREKTEALNNTLQDLALINHQLSAAKSEAEQAQQRFVDAIESFSDAFALYDENRRLVYCNSHYLNFWSQQPFVIEHQALAPEDMYMLAIEKGMIEHVEESSRTPEELTVRLWDQRWVKINQRKTSEGGSVMLYTDITELKLAETARFEAAMAEKSRVLQAMIDNLSQGVLMVDGDDRIKVFNRAFITISGIEKPPLAGEKIADLCQTSLLKVSRIASEKIHNHDVQIQTLADGRVIEVRSHSMGGDAYVNTYTDITQGYQDARELRENAQWLRLITDNVPALIAYVGADLDYQFTNRAYDEWYGFARGSLIGQHISVPRGPQRFRALKPFIERALAGETVMFEFEDNEDPSGQPRFVVKSLVPNKDARKKVTGLFVLNWDITERKRHAEQLTQSYQTLEARVQERTAQLQHVNYKLQSEVEERREAQARLLEAKKDAEHANLSKTKFLAAISHDLLQPLNAALLYLGSLQTLRMSSSVRRVTEALSFSLRDVESLITTLVDISKLDAGAVTADKQSLPMSDLLDNLADEFGVLAEKLDVDFRYVSTHVSVYTDPQLLGRIVRNLVTNALRYAPRGRVLLGCRRRENGVSVEVIDTGVGIPAEKQREIFQEFCRLDPKHDTHHHTQLGLGLAIVDKISRVLGHNVSVRSESGKGSCFSVLVPFGVQHDLAVAQKKLPILDQGVALQGARVWVIDNDPNICAAMSELLTLWGCEVISASSLSDLQMQCDLARTPVELLVVDYHLDDGENGIDLVTFINSQRVRPVATLLVTANRSEALSQQARESGYLVLFKPVSPIRLKTTLIHLIKQHSHTPPELVTQKNSDSSPV
ncbi:NahK/ErcS family hybrid sensor histidine kinase/response regulator [Veronia pacifica]|uniref:histidine kinase n=1 Tax=Veronia pacifica TaxID=1080227 RepID=A0A1C3EPV9_9GAMM|nr:NahK/ErcS family hybrid sensor histidine kinase/response regulator [Veronia pacifica]ODA35290.1 hybrid sensor histidine kinase/response regulator [Veronia pacifica]